MKTCDVCGKEVRAARQVPGPPHRWCFECRKSGQANQEVREAFDQDAFLFGQVEAADYLQVSQQAISKWVREGKLPVRTRLDGRAVQVFAKTDLDRLK